MSFAYMPLYTGDYLRDTRHLTPLRHGIYMLALMHCWDSKGPIPLDEQEQAGICNCRSADEIDALRYVIDRYFIKMDDGHYNKRMADEVVRFERISQERSAGGLRSAEVRRDKALRGRKAKNEHKLNISSTSVEDMSVSPSPSPSLSPTPSLKTEDSAAALRAAPPPAYRGDENEAEIQKTARVEIALQWELPESWGTDAEALGWRSRDILHQAERFRQYWTVGKGGGTRRSVKGWRQSWSNWLGKAEMMKVA